MKEYSSPLKSLLAAQHLGSLTVVSCALMCGVFLSMSMCYLCSCHGGCLAVQCCGMRKCLQLVSGVSRGQLLPCQCSLHGMECMSPDRTKRGKRAVLQADRQAYACMADCAETMNELLNCFAAA